MEGRGVFILFDGKNLIYQVDLASNKIMQENKINVCDEVGVNSLILKED